MAETTVTGFFESLQEKLAKNAPKLAGLTCVYQFKVGEANYNVAFTDGVAAVSRGEAPAPACTVTMAEGDFLDLVSGKLNGQMAFMTGKLKVAGDFGLALKLESLLKA
ncbi:MAG: SCP2 sterol-binding domain-containing protein [Deltaproteobacteria bacterium]|nr:SCP2 sterol-binding domain-containing protein [Deltaproteobacteria bacterium]PWB63353.1 MAG: sterol carrier protein [Deltaproteobacteria bacterium]